MLYQSEKLARPDCDTCRLTCGEYFTEHRGTAVCTRCLPRTELTLGTHQLKPEYRVNKLGQVVKRRLTPAKRASGMRVQHLTINNQWALVLGGHDIVGVGRTNRHLWPTRASLVCELNSLGLLVAQDGAVTANDRVTQGGV